MRIKTEDLFRQNEALRKRVEELDGLVSVLARSLMMSNDQVISLAAQVRDIEDRIRQPSRLPDRFTPPEG